MKHVALVLNALAALLLAWAAYGVVQLMRGPTAGVRPPAMELPALAPASNLDPAAVQSAVQMMARLTSAPPASAPALIGQPLPGSDVAGSLQMPGRNLSLHLTDLGTEAQSVVIDGRLVRQGTALADGGRVVRIRSDGVDVSEKLGRQVLKLPTDQVRIGTLRWADGTPASTSNFQFKSGGQP
jgi:hypothetical protein